MELSFKKIEKPNNSYGCYHCAPEDVLFLHIQHNMKICKKRTFKSYLKEIGVKYIQRTSMSLNDISFLLDISLRDAENLGVKWMNERKGDLVQHAGLNEFYLKGNCWIINP